MSYLTAVKEEPANLFISNKGRTLVSGVQGLNFGGSPTSWLPNKKSAGAGRAFEEDKPVGRSMVGQAMVVTWIGFVIWTQPSPSVFREHPGISERVASVIVFRAAV
jgi:hypothetical protein